MSNESPLILVVEDEADILELLRFNLDAQGFRVVGASTGEQGLSQATRHKPDLILLDLMLPGMDGLEVCRTIRQTEEVAATPIVMLTAKGEEEDVIKGLDSGADDYVVKPFSLQVLLARVRSNLRRGKESGGELKDNSIVKRPGLSMDSTRHKVQTDEGEISLTSSEFKALFHLASHPGRIFTRNQIMSAVHGEGYIVSERSIDVMIVGIRKKLGSIGSELETVRGVGYRMMEIE